MPTVFIEVSYRFYFFSREETRKHIHVSCPDGEVKFWIEPKIDVAIVINLSDAEVAKIQKTVERRLEEINESWNKHFAN